MQLLTTADGEQSSLADMMAAVKVLLEGLGEDVTAMGSSKLSGDHQVLPSFKILHASYM